MRPRQVFAPMLDLGSDPDTINPHQPVFAAASTVCEYISNIAQTAILSECAKHEHAVIGVSSDTSPFMSEI